MIVHPLLQIIAGQIEVPLVAATLGTKLLQAFVEIALARPIPGLCVMALYGCAFTSDFSFQLAPPDGLANISESIVASLHPDTLTHWQIFPRPFVNQK